MDKRKLLEIAHALDLGSIDDEKARTLLLGLLGVSPSLLHDAKDFLLAIETWNGREMKDGMKGHELVKMRPILLAKKVCKGICNEG